MFIPCGRKWVAQTAQERSFLKWALFCQEMDTRNALTGKALRDGKIWEIGMQKVPGYTTPPRLLALSSFFASASTRMTLSLSPANCQAAGRITPLPSGR